MKVANLIFSLSPFFVSTIFTYITFVSFATAIIAFGIWISMVVGFYIFLDFFILSIRSKKYSVKLVGKETRYKVAAFVTSFNEDPKIVEGTLMSIKTAIGNLGNVFLLDDSTNNKISTELKNFCNKNDIIYLHREKRRGYKAGAINDALKNISEKYDFVAIFDADQRPVEDFFKQVLPYFSDPAVALVQVPQNYSEINSGIASGAKYQQEPFLRIIMRGRSMSSAFSLGSGSVFRISALKDVGYMSENSVTEDAATSIKIHEKGYKSIYIDAPLIWYGEPPQDLNAYMIQQSRWAFGYFQLTKEIIFSNLDFSKFFDYFSGTLYWIKEGPITLIEFLAPIFFLMFKIPIMKINPVCYLLAYIPYLIFTIALFIFATRDKTEYGIKGFYFHQSVEYLEFPSITLAFVSWIMRKRTPFKVTPKETRKFNLNLILPHLFILFLLIFSDILGFIWLFSVRSYTLAYAISINIFWASYQIPFLIGGVILSKEFYKEKKYVSMSKVNN
ncbi:glycosyltransferase family 2 protein [Acidianus brierleyi]|uniref:Glucans biosynthesis glucosyltransferase H n=1 Tax=Acidianus brierleyi TaxID=41673 RepID=A0A2U9IBL6_9CREN|nr:cellulose synthase catalytic subunit [Acidianus brierleyi]AWR93402.1 glycosyltransferase [Acidianus brierleyi]